jgi:hypothetical protein
MYIKIKVNKLNKVDLIILKGGFKPPFIQRIFAPFTVTVVFENSQEEE